MAERTVYLPSGQAVSGVPDDVTDEQIFNIPEYAALIDEDKKLNFKETQQDLTELNGDGNRERGEEGEDKEDPETTFSDIGLDFVKVMASTGRSIAEIPVQAVNFVTGGGEEGAEKVSSRFDAATRLLADAVPFLSLEEKLFDEEGKLEDTKTMTGAAASIVPYIAGGTAAVGAKVISKAPSIIKSLGAGVVVDQVLADPKENLFNLAADYFEEGTLNDIASYLAVDEADSAVTARIKLVAEGLTLGGLAELLGGTLSVANKARKKFKKSYQNITDEEKGELVVDYLEEAKETAGLREPKETIVFSESPEGTAQIDMQQSSGIRRFLNQVFTSRGYFTPKAYSAFQDAENAQRATVARAENVALRLNVALRNVGDKADSQQVTEKVSEALTTDLKYKGESRETVIVDLQDRFGFTPEIADEVLNARELIDEVSADLVSSPTLDLNIREVISENAGTYVRRSYKLFEDGSYEPTDLVRRDAEDFLTAQNLKNNPSLSEEEAFAAAQTKVGEILESGKGSTDNDYFTKVKRVNEEIFKGKKEIPSEIRKLMGEIEDPSDNIILTVSKASKLFETNRFYDNLNALGESGGYIFNKNQPRPEGYKIISGTNSVLDGKYTTPEMVTAIQRKESDLITPTSDGHVANLYKNFLTLKGTSQKAKTVFSVTTHARNVLGGFQFATANGINPFKNSRATFGLLKNQINKQGQQGLDDLYNKYLDLGVINTNVNVNEFRALLDTGAETSIDKGLDKLKSYGGKTLGKVADTVEDVYLATDDYFKIISYNSELDNLKKAFPNRDIKVLETEAANIVKNTLPNYDRVPKGIKALRNMPIGSFVSFPAEIIRTSGHIIRQASREIKSGNKIIAARGRRRLAGFATTQSAWTGLGTGTAALTGISQDERDAYHTMTETPWSKDSPRLWMRKDGKIYSADTQFLDSYSVIKEPLMAAYREIQEGKLYGKDLEDYLFQATKSSLGSLLKPYVSPTILSQALGDVAFAAVADNGRTPEGKAIFTPGLTTREKGEAAAYHILDSFTPGTISSAKNIWDAASEKPNRSTGNIKDTQTEMMSTFTGVKFTEFTPQDTLMFASRDFKRRNSNVISKSPDYAKTSDDLINVYKNRQEQLYKNSQQFYRIVQASVTVQGRKKTAQQLLDEGLSVKAISQFMSGRFMPEKQTSRQLMSIAEKTPLKEGETLKDVVRRLQNEFARMYQTPLTTVDDKDKKLKKAIGGEVFNVPNAPKEPDERVDKLTGKPYNSQAGGAFVDKEERLGFSAGSKVIALAKTIFDNSKKAITAADAEKAAESIIKKADEGSYLNENMGLNNPTYEEFLDTETRVLLREKHDMDIDELKKVEGFDADWEQFSMNRGYTPEEFADFERSGKLKDQLQVETGVDFSADTNMIQTELDNIRARDMPYQIKSEGNLAEAYPKYETFYEDLELNKILNDTDYQQYEIEAKNIREDYEMDIEFAASSGEVEDAAELTAEMNLELRGLVEELVTPAKSQIKEALEVELAMLNEKELAVFNRIYEKMPEKSTGIKEVIKNPSDASTFTASSEMKEPVYRGTSTGFNFEYDIAFAIPRELGTHVGTKGQANTIMLKAIDNDTRNFAEKYLDETSLDEIYSYTEPTTGIPIAMSKGYINVKTPLVMEKDLGIWDAFAIANDPMLSGDLVEAVTKNLEDTGRDVSLAPLNNLLKRLSTPEFRDSVQEMLSPSKETFYGSILKADLNIKLREMLENVYKFDSIKYKNTAEDSLPTESDYSYILFKPNQFKNVNAAAFDPEDVRELYNEGGYIEKALRSVIQKGGELFGVDDKYKRKHEKKVTTFINDAIDRGIMPATYRVPTDNSGHGDFTKPFNEEAFNAFNHALLSYKEGRSPLRRAALQAKEYLQGVYYDNPQTEKVDRVNNKFGFSLVGKSDNDDQALADTLMGYYRTHHKLQMGEKLKEGEDLIFNVNDLELID
jgi:hypothetical protein